MKTKFRAWQPNDKSMLTWDDILINDMRVSLLFENDGAAIIMQWSGLKDRKGVDIYTGDILSLDCGSDGFKKHCVLFKDGCFGIEEDEFQGLYTLNMDFCQVEGNIYEQE